MSILLKKDFLEKKGSSACDSKRLILLFASFLGVQKQSLVLGILYYNLKRCPILKIMSIAPLPADESARLLSLCQYRILDTEPEVAFDDLANLAACICDAPIALMSLIDSQRQWFKAKVGLDITETPREIAFCSHTILQPDLLIVPDALTDERFANNPLVVAAPYIRFYAGVPLIMPDGHALGTLCVIDFVPRELTPRQIDSLKALARQAIAQLELRRKLLESEHLTRELQHNEAALRESETRFRTIADRAPVLIWIDDPEHGCIFHNQTYLDFTGRSFAEEAGYRWQEYVHPDDRASLAQRYASALESREAFTVDYRLRRADGEYRWMLETGVPRFLPDGMFTGFIGSCVDITDRKEAEQDRQLLKTVTQAIVTSADFHSALQVALQKVCEATQWEFGEAWVPNLDRTVIECSPAWYSKTDRLTEFRRQSESFTFTPGSGLPGRIWVSKRTEWHQDVSLETETYHRADAAMKAGLKATLGIPLLANNDVIAILIFYMFEARQEDQRLIDLIAASTELGLFIQRKQAEEEMRKSLAKEQELNRFKSNFIANMSHELRTPLTSVLGLSTVLMQQHFGPINAKQEQYLALIHSSGDHLLSLINDLLDLAKIEAGRQELNKTTVEVVQLCQSAIEMVEVRAIEKRQVISLTLPLVVDSIVVDKQRVVQILLNYLSNAVKFTPEGGTITLSSRLASRLELEASTLPPNATAPSIVTDSAAATVAPEAGFLVLDVTDTGIGIAPEKLHLLFQSFQQLDVASDRKYEGSGLGLSLTKQLAELHGGRVSVCSTLGHGSTFSVWLPL